MVENKNIVATIDQVEGNTESEKREQSLNEIIKDMVEYGFVFDKEKYKDIVENFVADNGDTFDEPSREEVYQLFAKLLADTAIDYIKWYMNDKEEEE